MSDKSSPSSHHCILSGLRACLCSLMILATTCVSYCFTITQLPNEGLFPLAYEKVFHSSLQTVEIKRIKCIEGLASPTE